jgi:hypothetical protein
MDDAKRLLDQQLKQTDRAVLSAGGSISRKQADTHALTEYEKLKTKQRSDRKTVADGKIAELKEAARKLGK